MNNLEYFNWDKDTVTLNDFTLEFAITEDLWSCFTKWGELHGKPLQARFEEFFTRHIERISETSRSEIVMIQYDFERSELLRLMKLRGKYLMNENQ